MATPKKPGQSTGNQGGIFQQVGPQGGKKPNYATVADNKPLPPTTKVLADYYKGYWKAQRAGQYKFIVFAADQEVEMRVDGEAVIEKTRTGGQIHVTVALEPGDHLIELTFGQSGGVYTGGLIWTTDSETGEPIEVVARPFSEAAR